MNKRNSHPGVTAEWKKSSYSGAHGDCVEVRSLGPGTVAVRDSKDPHGPSLAFGAPAWAAFVADVEAGSFGR
jgi:hypothetical protein